MTQASHRLSLLKQTLREPQPAQSGPRPQGSPHLPGPWGWALTQYESHKFFGFLDTVLSGQNYCAYGFIPCWTCWDDEKGNNLCLVSSRWGRQCPGLSSSSWRAFLKGRLWPRRKISWRVTRDKFEQVQKGFSWVKLRRGSCIK